MSSDAAFTKDNLEKYLRALAKEFRRLNGTEMPAEIVLIGGASVLANYGFRDTTYDIDAIIRASSVMKEAINNVGDKYKLPNGWLNTSFERTTSFSSKLLEHSDFFKTYSNILTIRTVTGEYLIAMKTMAGRLYKNDRSDIAGILLEHKRRGTPITLEQIRSAILRLYGSLDKIPKESWIFLEDAMTSDDLEKHYQACRDMERKNKTILVDIEKEKPGTLHPSNIDEVLAKVKMKLENESQDRDGK